MKQIAEGYEIDLSQVPIVGVTKPAHVKKLSEAMNVTLTAEDISRIEDEAARTGIRQQGSWEPQ